MILNIMKKNIFILIIIMFFLCNAGNLFASFDNGLKINEFSHISFEQFIQSLENKYRVKINVHGDFNDQNLVMKSGDFSLRDSLARFFKINNIKNSSFILNEKNKVAEVWILDDQKSNPVVGSIAGKKNVQVEDENSQIGSEFDSSSKPRTEFTDKEIEQLENDRREYEKSGLSPRDEFTEEELRQLEEDRQEYEKSGLRPRGEFTEEELRQLEEDRLELEN